MAVLGIARAIAQLITRAIAQSLEIFIPFEKFKRLNKRKYFVIPTASHKLHTFVTYKRLI